MSDEGDLTALLGALRHLVLVIEDRDPSAFKRCHLCASTLVLLDAHEESRGES